MANFWTWLVMGVIILGVIVYANPQLWEDVKETFVDTTGTLLENNTVMNPPQENEDVNSLEYKCKNDLDKWVDISNKKYGASYEILETEIFNDYRDANEFVDIWQAPCVRFQFSLQT